MCKANMAQADACEECANKCMLIHKKNRDPSSIVTSCVKVVIRNEFLSFLPLPPRFAQKVTSLVDQETWVEDSSGRRQKLTLSTTDGRLGFGEGWYSFSLDHGIEIGDILIINCILDSHFIVQIYGKSGCEKLTLPSRKSTPPKKRGRKKSDSVVRELGSASGKTKELSEEPCLMMVNRDTPSKGEEERITLYDDVFASETSKIKPVGEVVHVQNEIGSCNAEDSTENLIAREDALKNKLVDKVDNSDGKVKYKPNIESGKMSMSTIMHSESAKGAEKLDNGFAQGEDMLLDINAAFEGLLGNLPDANLDMNENWNYESYWSNIVGKKENGVSTINCAELQSDRAKDNSVPLPTKSDAPFSAPNVINEMHTSAQPRVQITSSDRQIDGNKGKSTQKEPASAAGGSQSTSFRYSSPKGAPSLGVKAVKSEPKEFNLEQDGAKFKPINLKVVKNESVDHAPPQATYLVTPNSEAFFETRRRLPTTTSRLEATSQVVLLRDSSGRRWPVLYHDRYGLKGFGSGWGSFAKANEIQCGDECVFTLDGQVENLYSVQVMRK